MRMLEDSHEWTMWQAAKLAPQIIGWNDTPQINAEVVAPPLVSTKKKTTRAAWAAKLQKRLNRWVKGAKDDNIEEILGYSRDHLIDHLERQFSRGMSWSNYAGNRKFKAKGTWVIDHIVPKSRFKATEAKEAFDLSNLRPLCINKNLHKSIQRTHLI